MKGGIQELNQEVDAFKEKEWIKSEIADQLYIKVDVATHDTIRRALELRPKILHICCYAGYEMEDGFPRLYYYLEKNEQVGVGDIYDIEMMKKLFNTLISFREYYRPILIIITCCFANALAQTLRELGMPNVLAVNKEGQINDELALNFTKLFYKELLQGNTIHKAYENALSTIHHAPKRVSLCCCCHAHKESCVWGRKLIEDRERTHFLHVANCKCNFGGNIHSRDCRWLSQIRELDFIIDPISSELQ